jgi:ammonia channel protein AmtB
MNLAFVHLFHIIFVGGLFLYIGIKQKNMPTTMYNVILATGVLILFYHFYKGYKKIITGKNAWVNIFHVLIVAPLLILTGIQKQNTPRYMYEFIFMLAFASIGYHGYYLFFN